MYQSLSHLYEIFLHDSQGFKFQWKRVKQLSTETPRGIADGKTCLFNLFKTTADVHLKTSILHMHAMSHELKYKLVSMV